MGATKRAMGIVVFAARLLVGGLLVAAAVTKIGHPEQLAAAIAGFRLLPAVLTGPLALALPYIELLLGGYLIAGLFARVAAVVSAVQFVLYGGAIASAVVRHIPAQCGCFGPNDSAVADWPHVAFDLGLAALSAFVAWGAPGALSLDGRMRT